MTRTPAHESKNVSSTGLGIEDRLTGTLMRFLKWFYPGMRVKRWFIMAIVGVLLFGMGSALLPLESGIALRLFSLVLLVNGLLLLALGVGGMVRSLLEVVSPG